MKIGRSAASIHNVYQVEYSMDYDDSVWYDLSSLDGDPFHDVARFIEVDPSPKWCKRMYCGPGHGPQDCDWPHKPETRCAPAADVKFYLC